MLEQKMIRVNLSERSIKPEVIPMEVVEKYVGGKGLAAYYLYKELQPKEEPLGAANKLMFFTGPLIGLPAYSRHLVASKSPLTDTFSDSYAGGWFGVELAKVGYSGIIIEGKADTLVYLRIEDGNLSVENAEHLRGKTTSETIDYFKDYQVAAIGPAGERLVRFACIVNGSTKAGRSGVAGRGGLGAVMGSKNLKAIVVKGREDLIQHVPETLRDKFRELRREFTEYLKKEVAPGIGLGGNLPVMQMSAGVKILPVKNFRRGFLEGYEAVDEDAFRKITTRKTTCYLCPLACGVSIRIDTGPFSGLELDKIEYETVALNGPNCLQLDKGAIAKICLLCNEYGMDTISVGNITSFLMECCEKGAIDYKLDYGDAEGQIKFVEAINRREGLGDLFAEGLKRAAEKLGLQKYAVHIKGLEIPGYDARGLRAMALAYATADRGGDHLRAWTVGAEVAKEILTTEGSIKVTKYLQDRNAALWCLIACDNIPGNTTGDPMKFVDYSIDALNVLSWRRFFGRDMDREKFLEIGERIYNLTRLFNLRQGLSRRDDSLPERLKEPREDTGWKIDEVDFRTMLDEYYRLRGWDEEGKPTSKTLERLQINL